MTARADVLAVGDRVFQQLRERLRYSDNDIREERPPARAIMIEATNAKTTLIRDLAPYLRNVGLKRPIVPRTIATTPPIRFAMV